ncbi:MAG: nicotinate (nicotinamide) nucleotide adenylyltransferase [Eubacteriales bacterium]
MGKIGVYGGSFNPPHLGHTMAVAEFQKELGLDKVLVIPAANPPHKALPAGSAQEHHRLAMTKLAMADLDFVEVSDMEMTRGGESYTADTLTALQKQYPKDKLFLLMGTDMFLSFPTWKHPKKIANMATIVTGFRGGRENRGDLEDMVGLIGKKYDGKAKIVENSFVEISSTEARRNLFFGCGHLNLAPAVLDYIHENKLYDLDKNTKNLEFAELKACSLSLHKLQRVPHVCGCCKTAAELAERWGANVEDARRAGILHDVTKALEKEEQLHLCKKYGIMTSGFEREHYKLLHSKTAASVAREVFGENEAVCQAIYWHTTGHADMTLLEKILYIADYMEPCRKFEGVDKMRYLTQTDLDGAMLYAFQMSIDLLNSEGKELDVYTVAARDYLLHERK